MNKTLIALVALCGLFILHAAPSQANPQEQQDREVGRIVALTPQAFVKSDINGQEAELALKHRIRLRDVVRTTAAGKVQILLDDDSTIALAPNSKAYVERFVYDAKQPDARFSMHLTQGMSRVVTGLIVKKNPDNYKVETPQASIGIRGTDCTVNITNDTTTIIANRITHNNIVITNMITGEQTPLAQTGMAVDVTGTKNSQPRNATPEERGLATQAMRNQPAAPAQSTEQAQSSGQQTAQAKSEAPQTAAQGTQNTAPDAPLVAADSGQNSALGSAPGLAGNADMNASLPGAPNIPAATPAIDTTPKLPDLAQLPPSQLLPPIGGDSGNGGIEDPGLNPGPGDPSGPPSGGLLPTQLSGHFEGGLNSTTGHAGQYGFQVNLGSGALSGAYMSVYKDNPGNHLFSVSNGHGQIDNNLSFQLDHTNNWGRPSLGQGIGQVSPSLGGSFNSNTGELDNIHWGAGIGMGDPNKDYTIGGSGTVNPGVR